MQIHKIQITLTPEEIVAISIKSKALGYNVTKYIKFLVMQEAHSVVESLPEITMSMGIEKKVLKALEEHKRGRSKKIEKISDLDKL
jgi:hypothetical protein